jgi:hypothetical protein
MLLENELKVKPNEPKAAAAAVASNIRGLLGRIQIFGQVTLKEFVVFYHSLNV